MEITKRSAAIRLAFEKGYRVVAGKVISAKNKNRKLTISVLGRTPYHTFNIALNAKERFPIPVHRLVAYQKFGDAALTPGAHTRHLDGNSLNNLDDNIIIGTGSDNALDRPKEERQKHAAKGRQKFTEEFIAQLRTEHASGMGYKKLREKHGLPLSTLSYYLSDNAKRTTFNHPKPNPPIYNNPKRREA